MSSLVVHDDPVGIFLVILAFVLVAIIYTAIEKRKTRRAKK